MGDIQRVRDWFDDGELLQPVAEGEATSVDLSRALAALCGVDDVAETRGSRHVAETIGPGDHHIFVLVDGLGMRTIETLPRSSFLSSNVAMELRAVFPSTTAAALTSLATGEYPACHAVPAWWTHLPEHGVTATILPFVERFSEKPLTDFGVSSEQAFPVPSLLHRYDCHVRSLLPRPIASSTYSRYAQAGAAAGYDDLRAAVDLAGEHVASNESTYTYIYFPLVDALGHRLGPDASEVRSMAIFVDEQLGRLAGSVPPDTRIAVSADHGMVQVPAATKHTLDRDDPLLELLDAPPYGEPRVPFFRAKDGREDTFAEAFRARFGHAFALLTVDEAEELLLFGPEPLSEVARGRIGSHIAITTGTDVLLYEPAEELHGYHAGLSAEEMRIPLVVA
jgi:hypothetical protein